MPKPVGPTRRAIAHRSIPLTVVAPGQHWRSRSGGRVAETGVAAGPMSSTAPRPHGPSELRHSVGGLPRR